MMISATTSFGMYPFPFSYLIFQLALRIESWIHIPILGYTIITFEHLGFFGIQYFIKLLIFPYIKCSLLITLDEYQEQSCLLKNKTYPFSLKDPLQDKNLRLQLNRNHQQDAVDHEQHIG